MAFLAALPEVAEVIGAGGAAEGAAGGAEAGGAGGLGEGMPKPGLFNDRRQSKGGGGGGVDPAGPLNAAKAAQGA